MIEADEKEYRHFELDGEAFLANDGTLDYGKDQQDLPEAVAISKGKNSERDTVLCERIELRDPLRTMLTN